MVFALSWDIQHKSVSLMSCLNDLSTPSLPNLSYLYGIKGLATSSA